MTDSKTDDYEMYFMNGDKAVPIGKPVTIECAKLEVNKRPRERKYCEIEFDYSEYHGDDSLSFSFKTFMTQKELRKFVREVIRDDR